jgi:hypothetical protein
VTLAGSVYQVDKLSPKHMGEFDAWLKSQVPDPRKEVLPLLKEMHSDVAKHAWDKAVEESHYWPPTFLDPQGQRLLLQTHVGQTEFLFVVLKRHQDGFTRKNAAELAEQIDYAELTTVFEALMPEDFAVPPKAEVVPVTAATNPPEPTATDSTSGSPS